MANIINVLFGGRDLGSAKSLSLFEKNVIQLQLNNEIIWPLITEDFWLEDDKGNKITKENPFIYYYNDNTNRYIYVRYDLNKFPDLDLNSSNISSWGGIEDIYSNTIIFEANYNYDGFATYTIEPIDSNGNHLIDSEGNEVELILYCLFNRYGNSSENIDITQYSYEGLEITTSQYDENTGAFRIKWQLYNSSTGNTEYIPCYVATWGQETTDNNGLYKINDQISSQAILYVSNDTEQPIS